jgi:hypothetical protein
MAKAKNLLVTIPEARVATPKIVEDKFIPSKKPLQRRLSRGLSFQTSASIGRWSARAKAKSRSMDMVELVDLKVNAMLEAVTFQLMTSKVNLASMAVQDLQVRKK